MHPADLSDPLALPATLPAMKALADPFSRVHPLFWPVLWVSLRAFVAWTGKLIEQGHGYAGLSIEITWYGWIRVVHLDLSPERARFNRHMLGVEEADWRSVLARAKQRVEMLHTSADDAEMRLPLPVAGCEGKGSMKSILRARSRVRAAPFPQKPVPADKSPPSPRASLISASPLSGRSHPLPRSGEGNSAPHR